MSSEEQEVRDLNALNRYFAMIPNIADGGRMSPHEYRLYAHYIHVGGMEAPCVETVEETAAACQMSKTTVITTRRALRENNWIDVRPIEGERRLAVRVRDWRIRNMLSCATSGEINQYREILEAHGWKPKAEIEARRPAVRRRPQRKKAPKTPKSPAPAPDPVPAPPPAPAPAPAAAPPPPSAAPAAPPNRHQQLIDAYVAALGYTPDSFGREGKAAKSLLTQYSDVAIETVIACYHHVKADKFWADKHLSLQTVHKNLGAYLTRNANAPVGVYTGQDADLSEFLS